MDVHEDAMLPEVSKEIKGAGEVQATASTAAPSTPAEQTLDHRDFTAAIAAPFYEEIMFRGFLLPSLTRYFPLWGAIAISSLIFAVAHLNLSEVLPLTVLGMVLGIVYTRSRNLLSSMLLHSLWNSGTLISLFLLGSGGN